MPENHSLPTPKELHDDLPISHQQSQFILKSRKEAVDILSGKDPHLILIVGPCSIHDITAAKEYAIKLKSLADETADIFLFIMRAYFEKPRSKLGWKGLLHDPHLDGTNDISAGLHLSRKFLLDLATLQ